MQLSAEQLDIAQVVQNETGNIMVMAGAGTGKSTTIRKVIPLFRGSVAVVMFGHDPAAEMAAKCAEEGIKADIGTFHRFGGRALRNAYKNAKLDKTGEKFKMICEKLGIPQHLHSFVKKAMSLAMQRGFGIFFPLNDKDQWFYLVDHFDLENELGEDNIGLQLKGREATIREALQFSAKAVKLGIQMVHEIYTFDDQIYAPLVLNLNFPKFGAVAVDEYQDSNACRREMARRMMAENGRFMGVGDEMQAIMGFTGADNDAMQQGIDLFNCKVMPLTYTRRCSKAVVRHANPFMPDLKAFDENEEGSVTEMSKVDFLKINLIPGTSVDPQDAVICRKTAPLIAICYNLLGRGIPAQVIGKDIGAGLLALVDRWKVRTLLQFKEKLQAYAEKQMAKLLSEKKDAQADALNDKVEALVAMMAVLPANATLADLRSQIDRLFSKPADGTTPAFVSLMTAHKSKGLEFRRVFGLGNAKWFPSPYAKQDWQIHQERCLQGVMITRAKTDYVDVVVGEEG